MSKNHYFLPSVLFLALLFTPKIKAQELDSIKPTTNNFEEPIDSSVLHMLDFSLEELMNIEINSGNLVGISASKNPVAITTITQEDIRLAPARNINDLIEIYVPGAMIAMHSNTEKIGIRGIIADRNYKYIVLVDGVNVNDQTKQGAHSELSNWDLNDIDKIEIIRGPGSVTYGAGAVGGVINITTKTGKTFDKLKGGYAYDNTYNSNGAFIEKGAEIGDLSIYGYASYRKTRGAEDINMYKPNPSRDVDYLGKDVSDTAEGPQLYMGDPIQKHPGIKAKLHIGYKDTWSLMTRFTQGGSTASMNSQRKYSDGLNSFRSLVYKNFMTSLKNTTEVNSKIKVTTQLNYLTQDNVSYLGQNSKNTFPSDYITNRNDYYSENEVSLNSRVNYDSGNKLKISAGAEYMHFNLNDSWGWGEEHDDMYIFEGGQNFVKSGDAIWFNDTLTGHKTYDSTKYVSTGDKGLNFNMISFFGEGSYNFTEKLSALVSARADAMNGSGLLFSPRLALIAEVNSSNFIRLIGQQSVRMTTLPSIYIASQQDEKADPETVRGLELMYTGLMLNKKLQINASALYNNVESIAWSGTKTDLVGTVEIGGIEAEVKYKTDNFLVILNHSFMKQLSFKMSDSLKIQNSSQPISYSDYEKTHKEITLKGTGNDLNNWANNSTKLILRYNTNFGLSAQIDCRINYGMQGSKDMFTMYENAYAAVNTDGLTDAQKATFESDKAKVLANIEEAKNNNMYGTNFRMNLTIAYRPKSFDYVEFIVYAQNLLSSNNNKYGYDWGVAQYFPNSVMYAQEPMSIGGKINFIF